MSAEEYRNVSTQVSLKNGDMISVWYNRYDGDDRILIQVFSGKDRNNPREVECAKGIVDIMSNIEFKD